MFCTWTDEETDDHVMGSGSDTWPWYFSNIELHSDGKYIVTMASPDDEEEEVEYTFTRGKVRSVATQIMMDKTSLNDRLVGYFKDDDPDADAMDCLIQICAYGEVVYG